jgi:hypothetical protein
VAEGVGDLLEPVQVDEHEPHRADAGQRVVPTLAQQGAVGQTGQRVVQGLLPVALGLGEGLPPAAGEHHGEPADHGPPGAEQDRRGDQQRPLHVTHEVQRLAGVGPVLLGLRLDQVLEVSKYGAT